MAALAVICRVLIAAIFLAASLGKFLDISRSRRTLHEFGLPQLLASPLGTILPIVELIIGIGLIFSATAWWSAVAAAVLFVSFGAAIAVNLFLGRKPECNCFGQIHSAPIGKRTLGLNALLLGGAILLVASGQDAYAPSFADLIASLTPAELVWAAVATFVFAASAATMWFLLELYKQNGRLLERIEALEAGALGQPKHVSAMNSVESTKTGLRVGSPAPDFEAEILSGGRMSLRDLVVLRKPLLLIFVDPDCGPCASMLPTVNGWQNDYGDFMTIAVISRGSRHANLRKIASHSIRNILLQKDREIANAYQAYGSPSALIVDQNSLIGSYIAQGSVQIASLVKNAYAKSFVALNSSLVKVGSSAPNLVFKELSGKTLKISDFNRRRLVLLFWNPACGFCSRMLEDLVSWERLYKDAATSLLVVSQGTVEENRRMGLRSTIVLDDDFLAGRVFGAGGTPSAVLVDENGLIASTIAVGSNQVFSLLGNKESVPMLDDAAAVDL
jgi:peroxiredoxin/uncharacterized membrane protein YphA (DoxX/SURF4 family)